MEFLREREIEIEMGSSSSRVKLVDRILVQVVDVGRDGGGGRGGGEEVDS